MSERDFDKLPEWLQQAWNLAPSIARKAQVELSALRQRVAELDEARNTAGVIDGVSLVDWLREELSLSADCRQRVAELERERDAARSGHDYAVAAQAKSTAYITELLQERGQSAFDSQEYKLNIRLMQKHNIKQQERVAELEASRAELMAQLAAFGNADAPNGEAIVTPNNCRNCQRAAEQMREAEAKTECASCRDGVTTSSTPVW